MSMVTTDAAAAPHRQPGRPVSATTARPIHRPGSVTNGYFNAFGLFCACLMLAAGLALGLNPIGTALLCTLAYATPIIVLELGVSRVHRRPSTGLGSVSPGIQWTRVMTKFVGFIGTLAAVAIVLAVIPFFSQRALQVPLAACMFVMPVVLLASISYIVFVDRRMTDPYDGYWHTGRILLGRWQELDGAKLREHALAWIIKGFYLPIMFYFLTTAIHRLETRGFENLTLGIPEFAVWFVGFTVFTELTIVCTGYFLTLRLFDSHIRTSNPFLGGWVVTLACYAPFSAVTLGNLLVYKDGLTWYDWFAPYDYIAIPWGLLIIAFTGLWVWATTMYGIRWSNLTYRGIITGGPYRFTKHPDYLAKSVFWWLIYVPFLHTQSGAEALNNCLMLLLINAIFFGRARYEEKHLSEDPDYVAYALWIEQHGVFRHLGRWLPFLRYQPPAGRTTAPVSADGGAQAS